MVHFGFLILVLFSGQYVRILDAVSDLADIRRLPRQYGRGRFDAEVGIISAGRVTVARSRRQTSKSVRAPAQ